MSDINLKPALSAPAKKPRQGRSPAFPFVPLGKAVERAEAFRVAEGGRPRHFSPLASAAAAWTMSSKTGQFLQTVAALGHFGLLEFQGGGDNRAMRLTDTALRILLDKQPISPERDDLLRQAALVPRIHAELWQRWGMALPSNATLETYLVRDRGFSETGARDLIVEYKDTLAFAKVDQPAIIPTANDEEMRADADDTEIEVGDLIQVEVEVDGAYALEKPDRVRAIQEHEGRRWLFVETSESGIQIEQAVLVEKGSGAANAPMAPPKMPLTATPTTPPASADLAQPPGGRRLVFALAEGDVVLTFPTGLSSDSVEDLEAYLEVFTRKARREAGLPAAKSQPGAA